MFSCRLVIIHCLLVLLSGNLRHFLLKVYISQLYIALSDAIRIVEAQGFALIFFQFDEGGIIFPVAQVVCDNPVPCTEDVLFIRGFTCKVCNFFLLFQECNDVIGVIIMVGFQVQGKALRFYVSFFLCHVEECIRHEQYFGLPDGAVALLVIGIELVVYFIRIVLTHRYRAEKKYFRQ